MKATITKIDRPVVVIVGEGKDQIVLFARTLFQANELANRYGATDIEVKDYKECLKFTHGLDLSPASSSGSKAASSKRRGSRSSS